MNGQHTSGKIAIVGLSCLFPGAATPDEFWQNLINGVNSTSPAESEQFGADPAVYYDPQRRTQDTTYSLRGGYVRARIDIPEGMDKAAGWTLYVAREALRDSGYLDRTDVLARCGLLLGNLSFPTQESHRAVAPIYDTALEGALGELLGADDFDLQRDPRPAKPDAALLSPAAVVANGLALGGVHFCIDAACASSLYAVGLACEYLAAGKADLMLAGAVSAADPLFVNMGFTHFGAYPDNGESRPLDSSSGGLISGEGAGLLVLKRYTDALRDGDHIYAVVGGVGLSNDGRGKHPLTPNSRGQILAFQRAYAGDVDPQTVQYVECHASGTPLGDKTELSSMDEFFGGHGAAPLIGSVKANHGHLLTVAGLASMLKVILSMQHGLIPASIGVKNPLTSQQFGAAQIVSRNTPWTQTAKAAGINAFGFGGVSAHLVLQSAASQPESTPQTRPPRTRMAIVGMDAQFGGCDGLDAFAQTLYDGTQHFTPLPPRRWKGLAEDAPSGAYIDSFEIDFLRFKFPPKEDDQPTPQHLLLLKTADSAARDAGLPEGSSVIVMVAMGPELSLHQYRSRLDLSWQIKDSLRRAGITLSDADEHDLAAAAKNAISPPAQVNQYMSYIGNIISSRVSALWNFSGPAFTVSSSENSVYKALEVAQLLLANDALDAVVIGAVDLAGGVEKVLLRRQMHPVSGGAPTLSFDQAADGWLVGEGAGAVVLKRADRAQGQRIYATIESLAIAPGGDASTVVATAQAALAAAEVRPEAVGYVEASASGIAAQDAAEIVGLNQAYASHTPDTTPLTALGSVKANVGHTGAAAGIASLIKTALCLYQRFIPAVLKWTAPKQPELWVNSPFYVAQESRTWFSRNDQPRLAALNSLSEDGTCAHVLLSDADTRHSAGEHRHTYLKSRDFYLFPIDADSEPELMQRLSQLEDGLHSGEPLRLLAQRAFAAFRRSGRVAAAIVGRDRTALLREIDLARKGIPEAFAHGGEWVTPGGSAFSALPLGAAGSLAFVYPGAFNSYPGLGQDLLHLFPGALDHLNTVSGDAGNRLASTLLYPRSLAAPSRAEVRAARLKLSEAPIAMMESGTTFAAIYTYILRQVFKVEPSAAFGYSLGEGSMLWAMEIWRDGSAASEVFKSSPLFTSRLYGRKEAVREAWGLPALAENNFWASYVLTASPASVHQQLTHESRVYVTHINTPTEVVIGGEPAACERVIERLGCASVRAPFDTVIHNEAIISEYDEFYRVHHWDVHNTAQNITFYSAADYEPIRLESGLIARSIARVCCKPVDFPRLISRAYRDGARLFVELGPGSTCTRWINDTLRSDNRPHIAVPIDNLRLDSHAALVKMLARLVSHRVPMDLSALYDENVRASEGKQLLRTITLGGEPVRDVILNEVNRRQFSRAAQPAAASVLSPAPRHAPALLEPAADHAATLQNRLSWLREMGTDLQAQMRNPAVMTPPAPQPAAPPPPMPEKPPSKPEPRYTPRPAIFDTASLDQFARGSIKACFGPEYAIYDHKRAPRIPNTDLMLVSRIVEVDAARLVTKTGSSMVAEYDVPVDMWFYRDNSSPFTPYSMLMEMALQPCGFLSAYMGPTLAFPDIDFYFRNLDGQGKLLREVDLRGRTLVNRVELLSSTVLQGIIIQKYSFDMQVDGESFYTGVSTFGYFTLQAFASQAGLDRGSPPAKWHEANAGVKLAQVAGSRGAASQRRSALALPKDQLAFLDDALIDLHGGSAGLGYIYATTNVDPSHWFFACHFHDDPVMPGSLGLEAIVQAVQAYAIHADLGRDFQSPRFGNVEGQEMVWKYRGQVLGDSQCVNVEVHITGVQRAGGQVQVFANASLWKGSLRIYEFKNVAVSLSEAQ